MPKLRFKADDGSEFPEWEEICFGDVFDEIIIRTSDTNKYSLYSLTIENGVTPKTERYERGYLVKKEDNSYKVVPPNAFVYNPMNLRFGALAVNHECFPVAVSGYYNVFCLKNNNVLIFWENYLVSKKMLDYYFSIATGSLIEKLRVHYSNFIKIKRKLPTLPEQRKIASFLSTIDEIIAKSRAEVEAWEKRKKGVIKKLFSQEVRFKADDGSEFPEWEEKKLRDITDRITRKNKNNETDIPLTISSIDGLVDQRTYFGKTIASKDMSGYYLLKNGEFAYNKSYSKGFDFGSIKRLDNYEQGALSTLYICFTLKNGYDSKFMVHLFDSQIWKKEVAARCAEGARNHGLLNISANDFFDISVKMPKSITEQQKIADCLSSLDEVIKKFKKELAAWEELKKGLLQQMFI